MLRLSTRAGARLPRAGAAGVVRRLATPALPGPATKSEFEPDLVREEEDTGLPAGFPKVREKEIWANPDMLLPERHELWWDDGTAVVESYVDRNWPVSTGQAAKELGSVLAFLIFGVGGLATLVGDSWMQAAPRHEHWPVDIDEFKKVEMGAKEDPRADPGYSKEGASEEEEEEED